MIKRATLRQKFTIREVLGNSLISADGGRVKYLSKDVDDHSIAKDLNVSVYTVQEIRREFFGDLVGVAKVTKTDALKSEIDSLSIKLHNLAQEHAELRLKFNTLAQLLALNNVVQCRHLVDRESSRASH
jgi:hypothetical protein